MQIGKRLGEWPSRTRNALALLVWAPAGILSVQGLVVLYAQGNFIDWPSAGPRSLIFLGALTAGAAALIWRG